MDLLLISSQGAFMWPAAVARLPLRQLGFLVQLQLRVSINWYILQKITWSNENSVYFNVVDDDW